MRNGWSPNAASRPAEEDEYGVLKLSAVSKGAFKPGENKALEGSTPVEDSFLIDRGDVLVTRANTPELVADACTVDTEVTDLIAPDLVFIVKVNEKRLRPQYLSEWLVTPPARAQIRADAHGSSGSMVKVSQQDFKSWQMPLPPLKEQERILEEINQIRMKSEELRESISQSISLLKEKRQALIKKAVTGQIDVIETQTPELETTT
jgi:type I restriction enzyme S subunit